MVEVALDLMTDEQIIDLLYIVNANQSQVRKTWLLMRDFENAIRESQQRLAPNFDAFSPGEVDHLLGKGTFMANLYKEACHRVANLPY